ncbi:hypothetical protein CICLE_v10006364mg [Citrus x clementina]|uniref:Uncharacterized protein n=1 Tax=Citrus clementina TaxID=85681 RepID=V4RH27_CITCL|nr:hypothetical protein CICLE_v10006364mg [Citrus x clementina]ESR33248.1 hypothetical protein CICLE_v10006364mg [Citrus x clementina]
MIKGRHATRTVNSFLFFVRRGRWVHRGVNKNKFERYSQASKNKRRSGMCLRDKWREKELQHLSTYISFFQVNKGN